MSGWTRHYARNILRIVVPILVVVLAGVAGYMITQDSEPDSPARAAAAMDEPAGAADADETPQPTATATVEPEEVVEVGDVAAPDPENLTSDEVAHFEPAEPLDGDLDDVLLLVDGANATNFDVNMAHVAEFYGVTLREVDVAAGPLTANVLFDANGAALKFIGAAASTLARMTPEGRQLLLEHVETEGVPLLVYEVNPATDPVMMANLTGGRILGARAPQDCCTDWTVTDASPELTREFTGQTVTLLASQRQIDNALVMAPVAEIDPPTILMTSTNDPGDTYPIFASIDRGQGTVYINAGGEGSRLGETTFFDMYYGEPFVGSPEFATLVPMLFVYRHAVGDEVWHNKVDYGNLTLDDPPLVAVNRLLDYKALLDEMEAHDYHTTIAFMPISYAQSENDIVGMFHEHPDRYSIVQHGNNNDGYEFYHYQPFEGALHPARPLYEQEQDIREGLTRMVTHEELTGIPFGRIMIFPMGIAPEDTMTVLKEYNYLATINRQDAPLNAEQPSDWDYNMRPANMDYESFPVIWRRSVSELGTGTDIGIFIQDAAFDLFIDKPALFYSHAYEGELFTAGIDAFDPLADAVNEMTDIEWASLNDIVLHLYLQKRNDDGSISIMMYANQMELTNESDVPVTYHVSKVETLNVPIRRYLIDGRDAPYSVEDDTFQSDFIIPPGATVRLAIIYGYGDS